MRDVLAEIRRGVCVSVSEAGASVYSASDVAREEFPDLDLTVRGAISIARRLQDPLAELVKIDPKSIGVGQYQHDVYQPLLAKKLDEVVESCVNHVGVELNTASAPLLGRVAGIGPSLAKKIVRHRDEKGPFETRDALLEVPGLGPQRLRAGRRLPAHPRRRAPARRERRAPRALRARRAHGEGPRRAAWRRSSATPPRSPASTSARYESRRRRLASRCTTSSPSSKKPGRDPRAAFEPPKFRDDVRTLEDLKPGMELEGVVTNVTAFGAFVDVGVHQDGLVHVSQLADRFVKDPSEVVKVGDQLKVRVLEVDLERRRISLSARDKIAARRGPS